MVCFVVNPFVFDVNFTVCSKAEISYNAIIPKHCNFLTVWIKNLLRGRICRSFDNLNRYRWLVTGEFVIYLLSIGIIPSRIFIDLYFKYIIFYICI